MKFYKLYNNFASKYIWPILTGNALAPDVFITNMDFLNWRQLKKSMISSTKYVKGLCLDIGAGNAPYYAMLKDKVDRYIIVDKKEVHEHMIDESKIEYLDCDIEALEFKDNYADTIILTQVLEHVKDFNKAMSEVNRVIKKDGILVISVPFIYHAHLVPYDYFRFSEYGIKKILGENNMEILEFHHQGYFGTTLAVMMNCFIMEYLKKFLFIRNTILLPFLLFIFTIFNLFGLFLDLFKVEKFTPNFFIIAKSRK